MVASSTNKIAVHFHSDRSYTDTGFSAEYLSYDSSDRELKPGGGGWELEVFCRINDRGLSLFYTSSVFL